IRIFTDCIVFVGAYASGLQDQFSVPDSGDQMYGVEIHANIVQGLLDGRTPVPANRLLTSLVNAVLAAAAYLISYKFRFRVSTAAVMLMTVSFFIVSVMLNTGGLTIPLLYAPMYIIIVYLINLGRRYAEEAIEKRRITAAFRKYVAPQVVEEISKSGKYNIKLGGENRHVAVLFVDIRGFTPMSESLEPEQVVDILNRYLNLTTNSIFNNGGTLDKFIGDATMAVFNAPFDLDDYIFRAVKTAWDIVSGGNAIEEEFLEKYGKSVSFGVGVNCGNAVVGNIGCDFRMDYTAIGDTVNTAARLESNAKRGQVLIGDSVYEEVKDRITADPVGEIPLKGKSKGVFVYSLTGIKE
ncbi:MAG: adenylate/guanylate cyclase domain-containing protein, partial [Oscillospiraceae bacterium]|nr:adenylate/guanylate cyclase domain-containing protein [Oscillospiraceae bacterium]